MGRSSNPFKGVNKVCAQFVRNDCKQFENVILVNCPKYTPRKRERISTSSYAKSTRIKNKGVKNVG